MEIRPCQWMAVFYSVAAQDRKERNAGLNLISYFYPDTVRIILSCLNLNNCHLLGIDFLDGVQGNEEYLLYSIFYGSRKEKFPGSNKTTIRFWHLPTGLHQLYGWLLVQHCPSQTLSNNRRLAELELSSNHYGHYVYRLLVFLNLWFFSFVWMIPHGYPIDSQYQSSLL